MALTSAQAQVRPGVVADINALTDIFNHYVHETALTCDTVRSTGEQQPSWSRGTEYNATEVLGYATGNLFRPEGVYGTRRMFS